MAISDHPDWFTISDEDKQIVIDQDFNENISEDKEYLSMSSADQETTRIGHKQGIESAAYNSKFNPSNIRREKNQREADASSYWGNTANKAITSHTNTIARAPIAGAMVGELDESDAVNLSKYLQKRNEQPATRAEKSLGVAVNKVVKATDRDGYWNDTKAIAEFMFVDLPQNIAGVGDVAAESLASMTTYGMGAWGGAKLGIGASMAIPIPGARAVGATLGTITGMIAAGTADAGSSKLAELVSNRLAEFDLAPTVSNITEILADKAWVAKAQGKSLAYGGILSLVDVALGGFATRIGRLSTKAARKAAIRSIDDVDATALRKMATDNNLSIDQVTTALVDNKTAALVKGNFKTKIGAYAGEVASEPISEAAATASIGQEIKAKSLIYETLGGLGAGPYGTAINLAAFGSKTAAGKTGKTVKSIIDSTPESRSATKEAKVAGKGMVATAKKIAQSVTNFGFKKDIENTDIEDSDTIDAWADSSSDKYDPIKAITKLAESDKHSDVQRAKDIEVELWNSKKANEARLDEIGAEVTAAGSATGAQVAEARALTTTLNFQQKAYDDIQDKNFQLRAKLNVFEGKTVIKPVVAETATSEDIVTNVTDSLGSSANKGTIDNKTIDAFLEREDVTPEIRELLTTRKAANDARDDVNIEGVANDIYHGIRGSEFRGIDSYNQGIKHYLNAKVSNVVMAKQELALMTKFRDAHQLKAKNFKEIYEVVKKKGIEGLSPKQATTYAGMQRDNPNLVIGKQSGKLVNAIEREAYALGQEVKVAESLFKAIETKSEVTTKVESTQTTEEAPAKPATAESFDYSKKTTTVLQGAVDRYKKAGVDNLTPIQVSRFKAATEELAKRETEGKITRFLDKVSKETATGVFTQDRLKQIRDMYQMAKGNPKLQDRIKEFGKKYGTKLAATKTKPEDITNGKETSTQEATDEVVPTVTDAQDGDAQVETKDSTDQTEAAIVSDNLEAFDKPKDDIDVVVTDSEENTSTKPYIEALNDIDSEVAEYEKVLACCKSK